jgi:DNA polymerase-2
VTARGPAPLEDVLAGSGSSGVDYAHYVDKQLAPACDVVLGALGASFDAIAGAQLSLFSLVPTRP